MTAKNLDIIKHFEGLRLQSYICPAGKLTIGYGHTRNVKQGDIITKAQAEGYLRHDVRIVEKFINRYDIDLTQNQFDALISFGYNCGIGAFEKRRKDGTVWRSTLWRKVLSDPNDLTIYTEFTKWIRANRKPLKGLLKRRIAEANLYFEI